MKDASFQELSFRSFKAHIPISWQFQVVQNLPRRPGFSRDQIVRDKTGMAMDLTLIRRDDLLIDAEKSATRENSAVLSPSTQEAIGPHNSATLLIGHVCQQTHLSLNFSHRRCANNFS
jgi:hypothetical protein